MPTWRKILYESQPFDDSYVDATFLEQLRTNTNVKDHDYVGMVKSTAAITQQICAVLSFFAVFVFIEEGAISATALGSLDVALALVGIVYLRLVLKYPLDIVDSLRSSLLFCATLSLLSPVLRTLTRSFADDTIWALAILFAFIHLISHDYSYVNSGIGRGTISLNAATFTAVLLGSRLHSNEQVFAFILLAIEVFAVFPMFQQAVKRHSERTHLIIAISMFLLSSVLTYRISVPLSFVSSFIVVFVAFVCPLWFMHVQEYKNEILGPWDIVHVQPEQ
ncbi:hypothetical protein PINS_up003880 [Pythium insidiosum]|nr:hypothetical protein PINS_up003880 [Pythium insidiosum]